VKLDDDGAGDDDGGGDGEDEGGGGGGSTKPPHVSRCWCRSAEPDEGPAAELSPTTRAAIAMKMVSGRRVVVILFIIIIVGAR